jgi:serine/threonine protein kinase
MTETGLSLGTPHYMSHEQASTDRDLSARSDVYSLGCVLYEMIAGQPPHTGPSAQSVLVRILTDSARPLTELRHTVPPHGAYSGLPPAPETIKPSPWFLRMPQLLGPPMHQPVT